MRCDLVCRLDYSMVSFRLQAAIRRIAIGFRGPHEPQTGQTQESIDKYWFHVILGLECP